MVVYQIHSPFARPIFPISFPTFLSIVLVLGYLQFLYGISFILRPVWPLRYGSRPFKKLIHNAEKQVLDLIVGIIPPPVYRSPVPSSAFANEETTFPRYTSVHHALYVGYDSARSTLPCVVELPDPPQAYPSIGRGRSSHNSHRENQMPDNSAKHLGPSPLAEVMHDHAGLHHHGALTGCQNNALATEQNQHLVFAPSTTLKMPHDQDQQREQEHPVIDVVHGIHIDSVEVNAIEVSAGEVSPLQTTKPNLSSRPTSSDEPRISLSVVPPSSSHYTDESITLSLSTNRNTKCRSTESYPGKFPVSDGLEYSSLATALSNFREKGTTHVRPFSDY
ncbi:hypothetical protein PMG11_04637 [Penicillium brasilianum]|uniref:Uncharacterized protein n=1 Tax=Penicillium brasilianum TaxID=104259 RepID=A0A0F7VDA0_PENBI|nr:hypothetical protein PMG11_04637 [Penicillium brasilianum]